MSFWNDPLTGVVLGGAITLAGTFGTQVYTERRAVWRETRAAQAKAAADWAVLQVQTIADLQEQIEEVTRVIGIVVADQTAPKRAKLTAFPDMTAYGRVVMLSSRLDDAELAADVRHWLRDTREWLVANGDRKVVEGREFSPLRDRKVSLQDRLGTLLLKYHRSDT